MLKEIQKIIDKNYDEMVSIRRYLHQHPELSFHEYKTAAYIADFYTDLDIPFIKDVGGNGIIATLKGGKPGKKIAFRADFDALPIKDEKDVSYKSKVDGVMHACGHDAHTASLLVLAKILKGFQKELPGTLVFVHQHAEEIPPGGANSIVKTGALDDIDAIFGNHFWATTEVGKIHTKQGSFMAGVDKLTIQINGAGGHGAYPHQTKDSIVIGSMLVTQLQTIISRRLDPLQTAVLTIGEFKSGSSFNIIADQAKLTGTVRYLDLDIQKQIINELERLVDGVAKTHDVEIILNYEKGYPPVINHPQETEMVLRAAQKVPEVNEAIEVNPQMAAEDFSYYLAHKPGAFFFTGAKKTKDSYPHHHPKFDIDEKALPIAAKVLIGAYFEAQNK
ncbi:MAG TPA: amidohydrolase [Pseudogracilibacillus sp.]|nr:amidohydrolase [Pseudogracilibacillus sp.]